LSYTSNPFCCDSFRDKISLLPRPAWTVILLFYASLCSMYHHTQLFLTEMESHKLFCLGCIVTIIVLTSTSQVAWDNRRPAIGWNQISWTPCHLSRLASNRSLSHQPSNPYISDFISPCYKKFKSNLNNSPCHQWIYSFIVEVKCRNWNFSVTQWNMAKCEILIMDQESADQHCMV
jgi:hypothetical protein